MSVTHDEGSSFSDFAEVAPGLFVGAHPEPEDPFELGATVVVCLASGTSVRSVPRDGVLVHWPIEDGPVPEPEALRGIASLIAGCLRSGVYFQSLKPQTAPLESLIRYCFVPR